MAKNINTTSGRMKKAVDQYWQEKVNAVLAKQQAQWATITNKTTQKTVEPAPAPTPAPAPVSVEPPVQTTPPAPISTVESIRAARQKVSSSTPIVKEPEANTVSTAEAEAQGNEILPESVTGVKPVTPEPLKVAPQTNEDGTTTTEPVAPVTETATTTKETVPVKNEFVPQNEDDAFQVLQKGGTLTKTVDNAKFTARYNAYQKINAMPAQSIADMNVAGLIDQKTMDRLAQLNPQKWAEVNKLTDNGIKIDTINQASERLYNSATGKKNVVEKKSEDVMQKYTESFEQGNAVVKSLYNKLSDGELSDMAVGIAEDDAAIEDMQDEMDKVYEDITATHSTLPRSMRLGMAAAATKDLNRQLTTMIRARNIKFATYNAKRDDIETEIKFAQESMGNTMNYLSNIYQTTRADEIRMEDFARADELLANQIAREDSKETAAIARLKEDQINNAKMALANAGGDPSLYATYDGVVKALGAIQKDIIDKWFKLNQFNADTNRMNAAQAYRTSPNDFIATTWPGGKPIFYNPDTKETYDPSKAAPTGQLVSVNTGNKNVQVDAVAASWLQNAMQQMKRAGIYVLTGKAHRDQAQTIKEMWDRVKMPGATAAQLRAAWHQIADVWHSNHEGGMAIDLYSDDKFSAPTQQQINIMQNNGWQWANIPGDAGHFEYVGNSQNEPFVNPEYEQFINTILGSTTLTKAQQDTVKNSIRNGEDPGTVIRNNAKTIMGQTNESKLTNFEVAKSQINDIQGLLKDFYAKGGDTSLLTWKYEDAINALWEVDNPELVDIATNIGAALQQYRNAVSGTAYSVQEGADIAKIFPWINKSEWLNTAIIKWRIKAFDSTINWYYEQALWKKWYAKLLELENAGNKIELDWISLLELQNETIPAYLAEWYTAEQIKAELKKQGINPNSFTF